MFIVFEYLPPYLPFTSLYFLPVAIQELVSNFFQEEAGILSHNPIWHNGLVNDIINFPIVVVVFKARSDL